MQNSQAGGQDTEGLVAAGARCLDDLREAHERCVHVGEDVII